MKMLLKCGIKIYKPKLYTKMFYLYVLLIIYISFFYKSIYAQTRTEEIANVTGTSSDTLVYTNDTDIKAKQIIGYSYVLNSACVYQQGRDHYLRSQTTVTVQGKNSSSDEWEDINTHLSGHTDGKYKTDTVYLAHPYNMLRFEYQSSSGSGDMGAIANGKVVLSLIIDEKKYTGPSLEFSGDSHLFYKALYDQEINNTESAPDISGLIGKELLVYAGSNDFALFTIGFKKIRFRAGQGSCSLYYDNASGTKTLLKTISSGKTEEIDVEPYDVLYMRSGTVYTHYLTVLE